MRTSIRMIINRELRRVPLDWEHPKDEQGRHIPLCPSGYYTPEDIAKLVAEGHSPEEIVSWCMPDFSHLPEEQLGLCVYETTSEGCPMSPVFADTPEGRWALVQYCANNVSVFADRMTNAEAWAELLFGGQAVLDLTHNRLLFKLTEPEAA